MAGEPKPPARFQVRASDGFLIQGFLWESGQRAALDRPIVIINAATSVRCRYYARFADYLYANGFDVITYDYRGIGESRPQSLRHFQASWSDWGALDFEAVLAHALERYPGRSIDVVAHSFGGLATGLARSARHLRRIVTVGAQFAYWRDYAPSSRLGMFVKWHMIMPGLTRIFGYFPGKKLGWLEDTPSGVVRDWSARTPAFEHRPSGRVLARSRGARDLVNATGRLLAISIADDPFGTVPAVDRLLGYFENCDRHLLRIAPGDIGVSEIGHFAFFHSRFKETLWPLPLAWLQGQSDFSDKPGQLVLKHPSRLRQRL